MKPSTDGKTFSENDIIVLCSDGIIDAFDDDEKLKNFINNLSTTNPQEIADKYNAEQETKDGISQRKEEEEEYYRSRGI